MRGGVCLEKTSRDLASFCLVWLFARMGNGGYSYDIMGWPGV